MLCAKDIVKRMIESLEQKGWKLCAVDDGNNEWQPVTTSEEVLDIAFGVHEAIIRFEKEKHFNTVLVIPMNGNDVISDHSNHNGFGKYMDEIIDNLTE